MYSPFPAILLTSLFLAACSTTGQLEAPEGEDMVFEVPEGARDPEIEKPWKGWFPVCDLDCLSTEHGGRVRIQREGETNTPISCWAFVDWGLEPNMNCIMYAQDRCDDIAHLVNKEDSRYERCTVQYSSCYIQEEMAACQVVD